jgi:O-antigen ligase
MQDFIAIHRAGSTANMQPLSRGQQIAIGVSTVLALTASFIWAKSLIPLAAVLTLIAAVLIIRNPVAAIFAFIVSNMALEFRPKDMIHSGAPGLFELMVGLLMAGVLAYWLVRLRILNGQVLSESIGQLCMVLFSVWSVFVTAVMTNGPHTSFPNALREMIDFVPLLILPILYYRFVEHDSKLEWSIFAAVYFSGMILIVWNIIQLRNHLVQVVYLYQIGRGNTDETLAAFFVLLSVSCLMSVRHRWIWVLSALTLILAFIGVLISFRRNLYLATIASILVILPMGSKREFKRGIKVMLLITIFCCAGVVFLFYSSHLFHLLLLNYGLRFSSASHLGTDLSLANRYVEWAYEWQAILHSPILGHGFGSQFLTYSLIWHYSFWSTNSHSSYLYMIFKTGFIGATLFFIAYFAFLREGFLLLKAKGLTKQDYIITRAILGYLIVFLLYAFTEPALDSKTDLVWIGLIWGYFLVSKKYCENVVLKHEPKV